MVNGFLTGTKGQAKGQCNLNATRSENELNCSPAGSEFKCMDEFRSVKIIVHLLNYQHLIK